MFQGRSSVINRIAQDRKEKVSMSRFFNNEAVSLEALIKANQDYCKEACEQEDPSEHLLVSHDSTDFNYKDHSGLFSIQDPHLGPTGYQGSEVGFFLHASLVLKAQNAFPLGLAHLFLWNRPWGQANCRARDYKRLPIEEKESHKWLINMRACSDLLKRHQPLTHIMDREGDLYELFAQDRPAAHHLLVRQCRERSLVEPQAAKMSQYLQALEPVSSITLEVKGTHHRRKRQARLKVSFGQVELKRPHACAKHYPPSLSLCVVQVEEYPDSVPAADTPIRWVLYTTHPVNDALAALEIVKWYTARWRIEELFSLIKTKGLCLEDSQLEQGIGLKKLSVMSAQVALAILQLIKDRSNEYGQSAKLIIPQQALLFVYALVKSLEGKTQAQQNPHPPESLAWLAWAIARLGGWSGYARASPPGPKTMSRGLHNFWQRLEGWTLVTANDNFF